VSGFSRTVFVRSVRLQPDRVVRSVRLQPDPCRYAVSGPRRTITFGIRALRPAPKTCCGDFVTPGARPGRTELVGQGASVHSPARTARPLSCTRLYARPAARVPPILIHAQPRPWTSVCPRFVIRAPSWRLFPVL